jgi:hypothetical protein
MTSSNNKFKNDFFILNHCTKVRQSFGACRLNCVVFFIFFIIFYYLYMYNIRSPWGGGGKT